MAPSTAGKATRTMQSPDGPTWATWQLLRVDLDAEMINVDAVELPEEADDTMALLTLSFERELIGDEADTLVGMLERWSSGTTLCQVFRAGTPEGSLALFHGTESLVVTGCST